MADNANQYHRPRTSRKLRNRLIAAADTAGLESPSFHNALQVAVAYLEMGVDQVPCPRCGSELSRQGGGRYECYGCSLSPLWTVVLDIKEPAMKQPPDPEQQIDGSYSAPRGNWNQQQF